MATTIGTKLKLKRSPLQAIMNLVLCKAFGHKFFFYAVNPLSDSYAVEIYYCSRCGEEKYEDIN